MVSANAHVIELCIVIMIAFSALMMLVGQKEKYLAWSDEVLVWLIAFFSWVT